MPFVCLRNHIGDIEKLLRWRRDNACEKAGSARGSGIDGGISCKADRTAARGQVALSHLMRILTRRLVAVLRSGQPYDPNYRQQLRKKAA
jgi:hypothetical protein